MLRAQGRGCNFSGVVCVGVSSKIFQWEGCKF